MGVVIGDKDLCSRTDKQVDVIGLGFVVIGKDVFIFKCRHQLVASRINIVISQKLEQSENSGGNQIGSQEPAVTQTGMERSNDRSIACHSRREKDDSNQRENRPQQTIEPGYEI